MSDTDLLRRAAARIREVAGQATPGPWCPEHVAECVNEEDGFGWTDHVAVNPDIGAFASAENAGHIAMWSPEVAMAVADWIDAEADIRPYTLPSSLALARLILGEA
jgi:hypothetical protein